MPDLYRIIGPVLRGLNPETAHDLTLRALELGLAGRPEVTPSDVLRTSCLGRTFPNPIGLAAGFDKDARVPDRMLDLGFGFVEVGSLTPQPQVGNPKPRIFRLVEDGAVINRLGFNNGGMEAAAARLSKRRSGRGILGVNIGKNKTTSDAVSDYRAAFDRLAPFADYIVVNISSPNTPGLRDLQAVESLRPLLQTLVAQRRDMAWSSKAPPMLLKLAPDLAMDDAVAAADLAGECGFDGLTISNTTIDRPDNLKSRDRDEAGGLSGRPLLEKSTEMVRAIYSAQSGALPIVGVGGVASGTDAYLKIRAGASLVQLYSGLVYGGPTLVLDILKSLEQLLGRDGYTSVADAVGVDS